MGVLLLLTGVNLRYRMSEDGLTAFESIATLLTEDTAFGDVVVFHDVAGDQLIRVQIGRLVDFDLNAHGIFLRVSKGFDRDFDVVVLLHQLDEEFPIFFGTRGVSAVNTLTFSVHLLGTGLVDVHAESLREATNARTIRGAIYPHGSARRTDD
jgi:predicted RNA-binding protein